MSAPAEPRSDEPVIYPQVSMASLTDRVCAIALRERAYLWWWIAFVPSVALLVLLIVASGYLFYAGLGIWGIDWPVMWGFAILSYVWWIAIASGGTIISALFFLMDVDWRTSINRIAESMMLFGAAVPQPPAVGLLGAAHLCVLLGTLLVHGTDPGSGQRPRPRHHAHPATPVRHFRLRLSRLEPPVAAPPRHLRGDGRGHGAGGGLDPQHRRS